MPHSPLKEPLLYHRSPEEGSHEQEQQKQTQQTQYEQQKQGRVFDRQGQWHTVVAACCRAIYGEGICRPCLEWHSGASDVRRCPRLNVLPRVGWGRLSDRGAHGTVSGTIRAHRI